jgi:hypothetical protein
LSDEDDDDDEVHDVALRQTESGKFSRLMDDSAGMDFNGGDTGTMNGLLRKMSLGAWEDDMGGSACAVCGMDRWAGPHKRSLRSVIRAGTAICLVCMGTPWEWD